MPETSANGDSPVLTSQLLNALGLDSLVLGARYWVWMATGIGLLLFVLVMWSYLSRNATRTPWIALGLKLFAILALLCCLVDPMRRVERPRPGANVLAIVADNSRSMELRPTGRDQSMIERLQAPLDSESAWQKRLAQDFDVRRYQFDARLQAVNDFSKLDASANSSSLAEALRTLKERFATHPVAGVLLFTDGLATDDLEDLLSSGQLPFPIYPVVVDGAEDIIDLELREASVSMSSFELAPVTVEAVLASRGLGGEKVVVRLMDADGQTMNRQTFSLDAKESQQKVRFQFQPGETKSAFVTLRAMLSSEDRDDILAESHLETTTVNNRSLVSVRRGEGPYRILYVAGRPNWELKFLRRALEEDVELKFQALVRVAKKEAKFGFRDRGVENANPLLAGFSEDEETAEQYDEPVLLRLGVAEQELKSGFPGNAEDLFHYHAIILDDLEAGFFSQQQMLLIRQFVSERGGGLMMLGGEESFNEGGYQDTPLGDVLPVYLRGTPPSSQEVGVLEAQYQLTREGSLEPWLRLRDNESDERTRVEEMPQFQAWNQVGAHKPGASVYAQLTTEEGTRSGLVGHRFGKGRALALMVSDMWRWSLRRSTTETDDLAQNWRQMARWLTNDSPQRVEARIEAPADTQQPHLIVVTLRDAAFKPLDNATVQLAVRGPDGRSMELVATPDAVYPGRYRAEYWSQLDGGYECTVSATGPDAEVLDVAHTGWVARPSAIEFSRVEPDRDLLNRLANASGGEVVRVEGLERLAASLPTRKVPVSETRLESIWHGPWLLCFAIACLCAEWGIRRWKGMP
ncbi:hypothetical protein [Aureliella helgolandensis]|uniref:Glutamine amidotransferase domain-containing protein n=1 Tax=Aureliella helgolandensis TaxID=2527968 RepID=A0A518GC19_9BACT|nr:hypothetical protein [Aureliella helgolandensis]QDV26156.1 hypothetical protein Q31a_45280 [Aureliella helgolandensis]